MWTPFWEAPAPIRVNPASLRLPERIPMPKTPAAPHVLILNNSQDVLALFDELLTGEGFQVSTQAFLDKDLDHIVELSPDLIILDYMWAGDDDGWALLQMLRMDRRTTGIPAIVCTGAIREAESLRTHMEKMNIRIVFKPFDIDTLLQAIQTALSGDGDLAESQ
jgi:CheY-like chemotaxis protein